MTHFETELLRTLRQSKMHLACLEMRVARMNFDLTLYVIWLRRPLACHAAIIGDLKIAWNWIENETW